jgi:hypothetical protein
LFACEPYALFGSEVREKWCRRKFPNTYEIFAVDDNTSYADIKRSQT